MFIQEFRGKIRDPELWKRQLDEWNDVLRPSAKGFLGSTSGLTPDGQLVSVVRFESEADARANSQRPEQQEWFERTRAAFDGEPTFHDCADVDVHGPGGSDDATFVQVMEGHSRDPKAMRAMEDEFSSSMDQKRPDILGTITGWEPDGSFVSVAYFTSEAEARRNEQTLGDDPRFQEYMGLLDRETAFYDLKEPVFA